MVYVQREPQAKPKVKRTTQSMMNPNNSLSAKQSDEWIRDSFNTIFMPTLLDHYGAQDDPWTLDLQKAAKTSKAAENANVHVRHPLPSDSPLS